MRRLISTQQTAQANNSFTLIELLIVIGIIAIISAAVVITINPTERLREARDATRTTDITTLDKSLSILDSQNASASFGTASTVYISIADTSATCANLGLDSLPSGYSYHCAPTSTLQNPDGTGWLPVDFTSEGIISLSALPIDPINTTSTGLWYSYVYGESSWEFESKMESSKYSDISAGDGGDSPTLFEKGRDLTVTPAAGLGQDLVLQYVRPSSNYMVAPYNSRMDIGTAWTVSFLLNIPASVVAGAVADQGYVLFNHASKWWITIKPKISDGRWQIGMQWWPVSGSAQYVYITKSPDDFPIADTTHRFTFTLSGSVAKAYLDGSYIGQSTVAGSPVSSSSFGLYFGKPDSNVWGGSVITAGAAELSIRNIVLSDSEIAAEQGPLTGSESGTRLFWSLGETSGSISTELITSTNFVWTGTPDRITSVDFYTSSSVR